MKISLNYRFIFRMTIFVVVATVLLFTISTFVSGKLWWPNLKEIFVYTACCTFFCSLLLSSLYENISLLSRILFFVAFTFLASLGVGMGLLTSSLILHGRVSVTNSYFLVIIIGVVFSGAITLFEVYKSQLKDKIVRLKAAELENEQLRRLESEARCNSLQAKLNPHFLFNTLNSLAALVYDDPRKVEKSIVRLSELYRSVLSISNQTFIPVEEELALIRDYLELEKLRFQNKMNYSIHSPEPNKNLKVPGLLIEPLVGNVVKHVLEKQKETVIIDISVQVDKKYVKISVSDNGPGFKTGNISSGYGLNSIRERLTLLYGEDYDFDIDTKSGKGTSISIRIPLDNNY